MDGGGSEVGVTIERLSAVVFRQCGTTTDLTDERAHGLYIAAGGMGSLTIGHVKLPISIGRAFYAAPGTKVTVAPYFNSLDLYHIAFERLRNASGETSPSWTPVRTGFASEGELPCGTDGRLLELANELRCCSDSREASAPYRRQKLFHELLYELAREAEAGRAAEQSDSHAAIKRTMLYVQEHYNEEIGREELARMANLSPEYYSQQFRAISGSSLTDYLAALRIQHAKEKLLFTSEKLADIAKAVGYRDEYYFSRKFKQLTGLSPSAYPKAEKKIVSLNPHLTRHLLALDITPAATLAFPWKFGTFQSLLEQRGCVCREWDKGFSDEELRGLRPDLLLCIDNVSPERLGLYRSIGPTLVVPWFLSDWRGHFRTVAKAVGKSEHAENWLDDFRMRAAQARTAVRNAGADGQSVLIYNIRSKSSFVYRDRGMGSQVVYGELQMPMPEKVRMVAVQDTSIPVEPDALLPDFAADLILLSVEPTDRARERIAEMRSSPVWRFPEPRVREVEMARWHGYDPLSVAMQLEDAVGLLTLQ